MATKHFKKQLSVEDVLSLYPNFALESAGGGGKAWKHPMDDGGQIIVTGVGSAFAPPEYAAEVDVGRYDKHFRIGSRPAELHSRCAITELEKILDRMLGF